MYLLGKPIGNVDEKDLWNLVHQSVSESRTLDYKLDFSGNGDSDKKEFLYDVTGMVNGGGGVILYGVDEMSGGIASDIPGITLPKPLPEVIIDIENKLRSNVNPRLQGHKIDAILLANKKHVVYIAVPSSLNAPHMVTFKDSNKFYGRNSAGKYPMDTQEIKDMVLLAADLPEKIRNWVNQRIESINSDQGVLRHGASLTQSIHIVPASSISGRDVLTPAELYDIQHKLHVFGGGNLKFRFNLNGSLTYFPQRNIPALTSSYTQLFRTGQIESVSGPSALAINDTKFDSFAFESRWIEHLEANFRALLKTKISPPMHISICLLGVAGFSFEFPPSVWETSEDEKREVLEDRLSLPPIWINSWEEAENVGKLIRPIIDALWNAVGEEQSPNYDISGNWTNDPKQKANITLR